MEAIDFFSSTYIPNNLVCREKEYSEVFDFIKNAYNGVKNTSLLISGPPGTGKSIVVRKALDNIYENANNYHFINAMDYRSALDFLNALSMAFPSSLAKSNGSFTSKLEFLKTQFISVGPTKSGLKLIIIDEVDHLFSRANSALAIKSLFSTSSSVDSKTALIGISNVTNFGLDGVSRVLFQPYGEKDIFAILSQRASFSATEFDPLPLRFISKKSSSASGDLRLALQMARSALIKLEKGQKLTLEAVNEALLVTERENGVQQRIRNLPSHQKALLCGIYCFTKQNSKNKKISKRTINFKKFYAGISDRFALPKVAFGDFQKCLELLASSELIRMGRVSSNPWLELSVDVNDLKDGLGGDDFAINVINNF